MADKQLIKKPVKTLSMLQLIVAFINGLFIGWMMLMGELLFLWWQQGYVYANHESVIWVEAVNNHWHQVFASTSTNTQRLINKLTHVIAAQRDNWANDMQEQASQANGALNNEMLVTQNNNNNQMKSALNNIHQGWQKLAGFLFCVTKVLFINMLLLILATPLFLLCIFVGLADGLMLRSIRKASLGRESAYLFHQLSNLFPALFQFLVVAFVVVSWKILPAYFFVGMATVMGCWIAQIVSRFKKYV